MLIRPNLFRVSTVIKVWQLFDFLKTAIDIINVTVKATINRLKNGPVSKRAIKA